MAYPLLLYSTVTESWATVLTEAKPIVTDSALAFERRGYHTSCHVRRTIVLSSVLLSAPRSHRRRLSEPGPRAHTGTHFSAPRFRVFPNHRALRARPGSAAIPRQGSPAPRSHFDRR